MARSQQWGMSMFRQARHERQCGGVWRREGLFTWFFFFREEDLSLFDAVA
jgi:hypothetical protein